MSLNVMTENTIVQAAPTDRSVLRLRRQQGDRGLDGRGRNLSMPPILQYGFRPFFVLAALHAGLAIPLWLWVYKSGFTIGGPFQAMEWHAHEMLFGYLGAVIAGFILTAVPNWTGRLPLSGAPLAGLVSLWLVGRLATAVVGAPLGAMLLDLAFPAALAAAVWREVVAGRNWRNAPVAAMLTFFALASATHHLEVMGFVADGTAARLAIGVTAMLIALIGGRIVPSFTRNWLARTGSERLPASFGLPDKAALLTTGAAMLAWIVLPFLSATGVLLSVAGVLLGIRLVRWAGLRTMREPILIILHLGYGWLASALLLLGLSILLPELIPASSAVHAFTAGAVGTMTLAVMTRASLGHTGREIRADRWTVAIYAAVTLGAALRVAAPLLPDLYLTLLGAGGGLWSLAFLLFAVRYGPILLRRRAV
jgi:uncharacterized protein involved in response to NO